MCCLILFLCLSLPLLLCCQRNYPQISLVGLLVATLHCSLCMSLNDGVRRLYSEHLFCPHPHDKTLHRPGLP